MSFWNREPKEEIGVPIANRIADRVKRICIGLHVSNDMMRVGGALIITSGRGKYIRLLHTDCLVEDIPQPLSDSLIRLSQAQAPDVNINDWQETTTDLAVLQAQVTDRLKRAAGKFVDRILAIAVADPGLYWKDFDGQLNYQTLCNSNQLAELTGLSVISRFPESDILVGGNAKCLNGLPLWLMYADRNSRVSQQTNVIVDCSSRTGVHWLPPSDGSDMDLPGIARMEVVGKRFVQRLMTTYLAGSPVEDLTKLYADGHPDQELIDRWRRLIPGSRIEIEDLMFETLEDYVASNQPSFSTLIRSTFSFISESIRSFFDRQSKRSGGVGCPLGEIWLCNQSGVNSAMTSELSREFPEATIRNISEMNVSPLTLQATIAAVQGLLHIDQMPANVPAITGASVQRILGCLTPGRPANYRQLLICMSDYCPPSMKLRDAV